MLAGYYTLARMSEQKKREQIWQSKEVEQDAIVRLAAATELPAPLCRVLLSRGYSDQTAVEAYLNPRLSHVQDPFELPGMRTAVDRIWRAIDEGERITVYGDYDVDGITSTTLLVRVFKQLGAGVQFFLPERHTEGYGLTLAGFERCMDETLPDLLVTVDCGTNSVEAVKAGKG